MHRSEEWGLNRYVVPYCAGREIAGLQPVPGVIPCRAFRPAFRSRCKPITCARQSGQSRFSVLQMPAGQPETRILPGVWGAGEVREFRLAIPVRFAYTAELGEVRAFAAIVRPVLESVGVFPADAGVTRVAESV